jgi:putative tryptophan/tyrosine transport system substrate-binding protein
MRRRELLLLLATGVIGAGAVRAQQKAMPVIGQLSAFSPPANLGDELRSPIHQGMSEMGFVEGQNVMSEYRWAESHYDRLPALAVDLVSRKVDVIVTVAGTSGALAAKNATSTIPIVFTDVGDPVGAGLVASLARPGGNLTGFSNMSIELTAKRLELLSELVPRAGVIALLVNPTNRAYTEPMISVAQEAAHARGLQLSIVQASSESEIDTAFATIVQLHASGLVIATDVFFYSRPQHLVTLASRYAIPAIAEFRGFAAAGGLMNYGADIIALLRQAGIYAGRILKGERPADLPVQQPTTFELVVNLKTARALGLTVPPAILARADEVIE